MLHCKKNIKLTEPNFKEARPNWSEVPVEIVTKIEKILEAKITLGKTEWGGFSNTACCLS